MNNETKGRTLTLRSIAIWTGVVLLLFVVFGLGKDEVVEVTTPAPIDQKTTIAEDLPSNISIIHSMSNYRADGANGYWVLIDPISISSSATYKSDVIETIRVIVNKHGVKVSLNIFDDTDALDLHFRQYGDLSLGRARTTSESQELARHLIATFDGDFDLNFVYDHEIMFFPGAINDTPEVGSLIETVEFVN